jgi:trehalose 6-phosphate phosphatase
VYESVSRRDNADLLERVVDLLAGERAGLVTDIDGTISPIVAVPEQAAVLPGVRRALQRLKDLLTVVGIVTGRSVSDARAMVGIEGLEYIGNHGLEVWRRGEAVTLPEARPWVPQIALVLEAVARALDAHEKAGIIVEDKGASASLHYRLAPDPDRTRLRLLAILARSAEADGLRVVEGRRVINVLPPLEINKGSAVTWLVREHELNHVVYLGDDLTDVDAFSALDALRRDGHVNALSIGVVGPETPPSVRLHADAAVPSVDAVVDLLRGALSRLGSGDSMEP